MNWNCVPTVLLVFLPCVLSIKLIPDNKSPKDGDKVVIVCHINSFKPGTFALISNKKNSAPLGSCYPDGKCSEYASYSFSANTDGVTVVILSFNSDTDNFTWMCQYDGDTDFFTFQPAQRISSTTVATSERISSTTVATSGSSASIGSGLALGNAVLCGIAIFMLYMLILHLLCG